MPKLKKVALNAYDFECLIEQGGSKRLKLWL